MSSILSLGRSYSFNEDRLNESLKNRLNEPLKNKKTQSILGQIFSVLSGLKGYLGKPSIKVDANLYQETSNQQYMLAHQVIDRLHLKGNETILDVGCGDGRLTHEIAEKLPKGRIYGTDASSDMIAHAKSFYQSKRFNIEFVHSPAENFHNKEKFDYIISFSAFLWFADPKKAFDNLASRLKPGGQMILVTPPKESCDWVYYEEAMKDPRWNYLKNTTACKRMLGMEDYRNLALKNNLKIKKLENKRFTYDQKNLESFKKYVKAWLFCYVNLPNQNVDPYLDVLAESASKYIINEKEGSEWKTGKIMRKKDGTLTIPYDCLVTTFQR